MDCCNNLQVAGSRAFTCPAPLFFSRWWPGNGLPLKKVLSTMPGDFTSVWYNWGQVLSQSLRTDYRGCLLQKQVKQRKKHCFHFTTVSDFPSCWRTFSSARLNCNLSHSFSLPRSRVGLWCTRTSKRLTHKSRHERNYTFTAQTNSMRVTDPCHQYSPPATYTFDTFNCEYNETCSWENGWFSQSAQKSWTRHMSTI